MSAIHAVTAMELWFGAGALALTVIVGVVLFPALRNALKEDTGESSGN